MTTLLVMVGSFLVVTVTVLVLNNINHIFKEVSESFQVSVYLTTEGEKEEHKAKIKTLIEESKIFSDVAYVSKDMALQDFKTKMAEQLPSFVLEENDVNPLPSSFALKINEQFNNKAGFNKVGSFVDGLLSVIGVEDISYGKSWVNKYSAILASYNIGSLAFILFLLMSVFLVVGNSIKSSIAQRRKEIEVLELVGATRMYIRMPFILEGAFMGLISSAISIGLTYALYQSIVSISAANNAESLFANLNLQFLPLHISLLICLASSVLGAMSAMLCIGKMNTGWAALSD